LREDVLSFSSENHKICPVEKSQSSGVSTKVPTTSVRTQAPPAWFRADWLLGLILILFVILAYTPVWKAGFVWDDEMILTANPCVVGPLGLREIWATSAADICPLTLTIFWAEHALWGLNPLPYHLVNVLMHGLSAVLLWRVLRCLCIRGAWLGAALWALHPVAVESVAWITEMKNTESGLFFLLSILFFVRWLRAKDFGARTGGRGSYALCLLFAALAMAAKSSTVILPVVLCLCGWWIEGRWHWRIVARTAPLFLMAIAASALSIWTQVSQLAIVTDPQWARTWPERLATAGNSVWFYLGKLLWPHPLITIYPRWHIDAGHWISYLPLLALIVILFIFWLRRRSGGAGSRACFFAFAYFIVALLPTLGLIDTYIFQYSFVFDHFQYLASIGPLALAATALVQLSDFIITKKAWLQSALCAGVLLILGIASWQRSWVYESEEALWTDTLAKNPDSWAAHHNLGLALFRKGQVDDAVAQYQKTLEINPNYVLAHNNLGVTLLQKGRLDDAVTQYQKALEINPNYPELHDNLGNALFRKGQVDDAVAQYQKALEINPNYAHAHYNLGNALFQKGQVDDAVAHYQMALEINPDYPEAQSDLGLAFVQKGQLDEAIAQFQKAVKISPNSPEIHYNLGNALFQKGRMDDAVAHYQKALGINPNYPEARNNLGNALFQKGQVDDAVAQYQNALKINPNYPEAHYNLARALIQNGQLDSAITQFQEILRLKPDFSPAQDKLNEVRALVQQGKGNH
jgi:tetratricopeptide (TPR) repeat protein